MWLQYYSLNITYFKSSLDLHLIDLLWTKFEVNMLSSSPLLGNWNYVARQLVDLGEMHSLLSSKVLSSRFYSGFAL